MRAATSECQSLRDTSPATDQPLRDGSSAMRRDAQSAATEIVGTSPAFQRALDAVAQVAPTDTTVLLLGETGTGKELLATRVHELSARRGRPMVRVNCAAIPATLIESELFGRERGAFTDAFSRQIGRFELADQSTIFLDEIGDLPPAVQVKLLRVLEERQFERLGNPHPVTVNVRVIAATHRDLHAEVAAGTFREDLFYRLDVFPIDVPPLRERVEDIARIAQHFVQEFSEKLDKPIESIAPASLVALERYTWPGNIRELRNAVERAMIVADGARLVIPVPSVKPQGVGRSEKLQDVQREHIQNILERVRWRIRGEGGAAEQLGLRPSTLETRMAKLGLYRPRAS